MKNRRIHITGASGSGVTTLGRELAGAMAVPHHDTDDFYWLPVDVPYTAKRPIAERLRLMREIFVGRPSWVLSGSLSGWGDPLIACFDLVVFVSTNTPLRLERLRAREKRRFGRDAVAPGGERWEASEAFLDWAAQYDNGDHRGRSRARHEAWLAELSCPVVSVDGSEPIATLVTQLMLRVDAI